MKTVFASLLCGLYIFIVFGSGSVSASTALSVSPAIIERAVEPGETLEVPLRIQNNAVNPLPLTFFAESASGFETIAPQARLRYDASTWIQFPETTTIFSAGESRVISVTIAVPQDAPAGGQYARIGVRALSLEQMDQTSRQSVIPEIGVSVLLTVAGDIDNTLSIVTKNIFPWYAVRSSEVSTNVTIRNAGNVHNLVGPLVIVQKDGQEVQRFSATPTILLPEAEKSFRLELQDIDRHGRYNILLYQNTADEFSGGEPLRESIIIGPSLVRLILLAVLVWTVLFGLQNRRNVRRAVAVLLGRD